MKKNSVTISILVLVILLLSMVTMVFISRAAEQDIKNPYDSENLTVDEIIATYHTNMNDAFNRYLKLMMTNIEKNPDDPNGKAFKEDGTPFTVADCLDPANANNYSTFCVAVNLLGGNSANCYAPPELYTPPEDFKKFCSLGGNAQALKGYLNFKAALLKKAGKIFETNKDETLWTEDFCNGFVVAVTFGAVPGYCSDVKKSNSDYSTQVDASRALRNQGSVLGALAGRTTLIQNEIKKAKETLDQTLSAYDQLRVAWPIHKKYIDVYADLEKYRDKITEIRHQTDLFPKKFIDLTTTACI